MEAAAFFLGRLFALLFLLGVVVWVLVFIEFLPWCAGVFGGFFEQITKKRGYF